MIPGITALPDLLRLQRIDGVTVATGQDECAGAAFSGCMGFRYALWRIWDVTLPLWSFGMLNPSTADHLKLDPTLRRCEGFTMAGGAGGMIIWNLFAWRATDPAAMKRRHNPIGLHNDDITRRLVKLCAMNVAGWGIHGTHRDREARVRAMLADDGTPLHALAFTKAGQPCHPLYLPGSLKPLFWAYDKAPA